MQFGDKRVSVCFSLDKEMDLYEVAASMASEKRFSAWVKRYLAAELQRRNAPRSSQLTAKLGDAP